MTDPVVRLRGQVVQRPKEQVGLPGGIVDWLVWLVIRPIEQVGLPGGIVDWLDCGFVGFFGPKTPRSR